jgi:hypothetical protein
MAFLLNNVAAHEKRIISVFLRSGVSPEKCGFLDVASPHIVSHRARRSRSTFAGRAIGEAGGSRPPGAMRISLRLCRHYLHFSETRPRDPFALWEIFP